MRIVEGGGTTPGTRRGAGDDPPPHKRRQFVPANELIEAFAHAPSIDYEEFRADIYAVVDPTPRNWFGQ